MRVYLDNCCFNRPFDDQSNIRVKLETDAKLFVQSLILEKRIELAWSYILDFENEANPFFERKYTIEKWRRIAIIDIEENEVILTKASILKKSGIKSKDALHISCAIATQCDFFLTTDDTVLKKMQGSNQIRVSNPIQFIQDFEFQRL